jgi:hypothetical protein
MWEVEVATLTVALPHEHLSCLRNVANRLGIAPEQLVRLGAGALLARSEASPHRTDFATRRPTDACDESPRNILELDGLGKEIWAGIDVRDYVDQLRESWTPVRRIGTDVA